MKNALPLLLLLCGSLQAQTEPVVNAKPTPVFGTQTGTDADIANADQSLISIISRPDIEARELEIAPDVIAYATPGKASVSFKSKLNLIGERASVSDKSGKLVLQRLIGGENILELSALASGAFTIVFDNKKLASFEISKQ